jgi:hypothetical protein
VLWDDPCLYASGLTAATGQQQETARIVKEFDGENNGTIAPNEVEANQQP